jgi:signal transduction histidine kinase/CheY-like chemotaxis protein
MINFNLFRLIILSTNSFKIKNKNKSKKQQMADYNQTSFYSHYNNNFNVHPYIWQEKEKARLQNIEDYNINELQVDDEGLVCIARLAANICNTPCGAVDIVKSDIIEIITKIGFDDRYVDRTNSFCTNTIEQDDVLIVEDTLEDHRFDENKYVNAKENKLRFYAGHPLRTKEGYNIGVICVFDTQPKTLDDKQKDALKTLSKQVVNFLELKRQNKNLIAANALAEKLAKSKDEFFSNISHELRTPLNAISGYAEILSKCQLTEEQMEAVNTIKNSSEILIKLINDILDFSKINSGKLTIEHLPFNLQKTVKLVYDLLYIKAEQKGLEFKLNYDDGIPDIILGDKVRINQIIMNLVGNAIKFTERGSVRIDVSLIRENIDEKCVNTECGKNENKEHFEKCVKNVKYKKYQNFEKCVKNLTEQSKNIENFEKCKNNGKFEKCERCENNAIIKFSIKDTGIGIEEGKLKSIFNRFEQAEGGTTFRKYGGTGLGLNISRNLVELQGGKLNVNSKFGEGTEFYFELKFDLPKDIKVSELQPQPLPQEVKDNSTENIENNELDYNHLMKNLKILVCEDNPINIKLIELVLKSKVSELVFAENGQIAIDFLKNKSFNNNFDMILMDIQMPVMDGMKTTEYIRQSLKLDIPILGHSANFNESEREQALNIGMNDYFLKNFVAQEIYEKICKNILENKRRVKINIKNEILNPKNRRSKSNVCAVLKNEKKDFPKISKSKSYFEIRNLENINKNKSSFYFEKTPSKNVDHQSSEKDQIPQTDTFNENYGSPRFDHVNLKTLAEYSGGDKEFEQQFIEIFLENFHKDIKSLEADVHTENLSQVSFWTHKMKGPLLMLGLFRIIEQLEKLKTLSLNPDDKIKLKLETEKFIKNINYIYIELKEILVRIKNPLIK